MFRHELSLIGLMRAMALVLAFSLMLSAAYVGRMTEAFTSEATHVAARVADDGAVANNTALEFSTPGGALVRRFVSVTEAIPRGTPIPILYISRGGVFDIRLIALVISGHPCGTWWNGR